MHGKRLDVCSEVSLKRMAISECHHHNGPNSRCNLFSENVDDEAPISALNTSLHHEMCKINADRTTKVQRVNDLGCEDDNISCISKADGTHLEIGGHNGDADQKIVTGSSSSVNSFYENGSEKPIHVQSVKHGSLTSDCIAEEGNNFKGSQYARESLHSAADMSDRSDPSETSSFREEHSGVVSPKVVLFSPARGTGSLADSQKCSHQCIDRLKSDTQIDGNQTSAIALNKLDQKQHLEMRETIDLHEPSMQYCAVEANEHSDELVDVRVCDICGDAGRECLLALCSKCNDGAEHIYCMRIKMDKVPDGDWICEECMITAEAQMQKVEQQKISGALQKSSTNEMAPSLRKLNLSDDNGRVRVAHALVSSRKRPRANIEVSPSTKKRVFDKLWSPLVSYAKGMLPRQDNLKIMAKGEVASSSGSKSLGNVLWKDHQPSAGKSSNIKSQFYRGSLSKQKCSNSTDLRTRQESEDVYTEQNAAKGSPNFGAGPRHALTKLGKSKSFISSSVASLDTTDSMKNMHNNFKNPKLGNKCSITQRSYSFNSKISQPVSPLGGSSTSRVKPSKATSTPLEVKKQIAETAEVRRDLERATERCVAKRQCDTNSSGLNKKMICTVADKGISPGNFGRLSTACFEQKADRKSTNMKAGPMSKEINCQLIDTGKVQVHRSLSGETVLLGASAHPDVDCMWRGILNVKECNKLPMSCPGLQAHLSTCASLKAYEVVSKFPCEIRVKEVLRRDIWPAHFMENHVTEDNIALYFFAEDVESYQSYRKFLNCMVLNDLALKSNLDDVELMIFPSQILPARSQRWNNLFFLWGVFRAKKLSLPNGCVPSPCKGIQIPLSDAITAPKHPHIPIPPISEPRNSNISTQIGQELCAADALSGSVQGFESNSQRELGSSVSTKPKCMEGSSVNEVDVKTMATTPMKKEQHSRELQAANKAQEEKRSWNKDPEVKTVDKSCPCVPGALTSAEPTVGVECTKDIWFATGEKHQADIALNYPCNEHSSAINVPVHANGLQVYDKFNSGSISLNLHPSDSGETETSENVMGHQALNLELALWSEPKPANEGGLDLVLDHPKGNAHHGNVEADDFVSLDLSLAWPSTDDGPVPMMEELLPVPDKDDVDTSLFLFRGVKKA